MRGGVIVCALALTGCAMAEYGTHSLGTTPLVTPFNSAENGWRPASPRSESYFQSGGGYRAKPHSVWECRSWCGCSYFKPAGPSGWPPASPYRTTVTTHGEAKTHRVLKIAIKMAELHVINYCQTLNHTAVVVPKSIVTSCVETIAP